MTFATFHGAAQPIRRRPAAVLAMTLGLGLASSAAWAQDWPNRPVRIVSIAGAGSGLDDFTRLMAKTLSDKLGQGVFVDNRPGANGMLATDAVAKSKPDGYTFLFTSGSTVLASQFQYKKLPYRNEDLVPVVRLVGIPLVLTVGQGSPIHSVADLKTQGQANPGKLSSAHTTVGFRALTAGLSNQLKVKTVEVPYKSAATLLPDLITNTVDYAMVEISTVTPMVQSQRLRALAVSTPKRVPQLPNVPTFDEAGLGSAALVSWVGLLAPAGTPQPVIDKVSKLALEFLQSPEATAHFAQRGTFAYGADSHALTQSLDEERKRWKHFFDLAGIQPE